VTNPSLARALTFHSQNRLPEAEPFYREVLKQQPENAHALEGLGVLVFQLGRAAEAVELFSKAATLRPGTPLLHANLGEALRVMKRLDEASAELQKAYRLDPTLFQTWNSLGLLAHDRRQFAEAERAFREALRLRPNFAAGYINLGNTFQARQRPGEAIEAFRAALKIEPENFIALTNLGQVLGDLGKASLLDEAETACRKAVRLAPHLPHVHTNLGNVLRHQGRLDDALACYKKALALDPRHPGARGSIGHILKEQGNYAEADQVFRRVIDLEPGSAQPLADYAGLQAERGQHAEAAREFGKAVECDAGFAEAHHGLAVALLEQGKLDEAEPYFREALRLNPNLAISWAALARLQAERGDIELSCESARRALAINPELTEGFWRLAINLKGKLPEADFEAMKALLQARYLPPANRAMLLFAVATACDGRALYSQAAEYLEQANALQMAVKRSHGATYDTQAHSRTITRLCASFTPGFVALRRGWGDPDPRPVFVVGLPRSGTTLTEQILASHAQVCGIGEPNDLHRIFTSLPELVKQPALDSFQSLEVLNPDSAKAAARAYLATLDAAAPRSALRVVDKMPDNFRLLGFIAILFPSARVIVCNRDLRDIAISCWQTGFERNNWTNSWQHIAERFADYQRMMRHWRHTQPLEVLELSYEHLVCNIELEARRLIEFIGLDWDPACLEFHATRRVVRTASLVQVRQPVYTNSVARWRHYEASLQPLLEACKRLGVEVEDPAPRTRDER
jgi:tetratricopeptide (TPR) repeat protein